jgi:hypothetical protein
MILPASHQDSPEHEAYCARVEELEAEGLTTSDAQGVADVEFQRRRMQEKHATAMEQQAERFARKEEEKRLFKAKVQQYVSQGIPKLLAISYAKHGWDHAFPRQ